MTMFEQRILCHRLPESPDTIMSNVDVKELTKRHCKMLQELKRAKLDIELKEYEEKIHHYKQQYDEEFNILQQQIQNPTDSQQKDTIDAVLYLVQSYFNHYTNKRLRQIRYKETCFHVTLTRHSRRHHRHRQHRSLSEENMINVYPRVIVDVPKISLNRAQLDYLSHKGRSAIVFNSFFDKSEAKHKSILYSGPSYIRPNQSYLYPEKLRLKQVKQEYNSLLNVIIPYLVRVYRMSSTTTIIKQFSHQLANYLCEQYMAPISYLDVDRAKKELQMMKSIQYSLRRGKYVLRVTDKGGIFHIGHSKDYEQKVDAYRQKTGAYVELATDPLWTIFDKVVQLLNNLRSKKQIFAWQADKMMPKRDKVKLAHLYFVPKPHKVILTVISFPSLFACHHACRKELH